MLGDTLYDCTKEFPVWALLPKKETGVDTLISKHNTYDGRGVVIAIFDSGIDPFAPGLQTTTDGKKKIIDRIDASGAGDVDTSTVLEACAGSCIKGLFGRKLKIPSEINNPSKKYHIGIKSAYSLYPPKLRERVLREKKERLWDPEHKRVIADAQRVVQNFESQKSSQSDVSGNTTNGSSNDSNKCAENGNGSPDEPKQTLNECVDSPASNTGTSSGLSQFEKLQKEDNEVRLTLLKNLEKKHADVGPSYDCVVYHDGSMYRAYIDTSETGDLSKALHLGEYRKDFSVQYLTDKDQYTISINVHNEGNVLEIVGMCSAHGTHVASIAAANFPDNPSKNGVAPGAKIVSIQIGDNRLGSMETGTALVRAMARVMDNPDYKVDIINMSYGEHSHWSYGGRVGEIVNEVVNRYGTIWVASAGNHGPALGTVGVPPDFATDCIIGVGAYVSPEMMTTDHHLVEKMPGCPYTWSSRGPTFDGGRGVSVCAPGGAVTSVPNFMLKQNVLMNGTSMASPHVAGCMALLLSGLKDCDIPYSPYSVRRAVQNTALTLDIDPFAQGHGLIQVHKALEYLLVQKPCDTLENKVQIAVDCGGRERRKGVHLRNWKANRVAETNVTIEPQFLDDSNVDPQDKLNFNMEFFLSCDSSFVKFPSHIQCSYTARVFKIFIDPSGLQPGHAYFMPVKGFSTTSMDRGPFFEIPITIIIPMEIPKHIYTRPSEHYPASKVCRSFLAVPPDASFAIIKLKSTNTDKPQRFTLHAVQLRPASSVTTFEYYKNLVLTSNETTTHVFAVRGGLTLEVCISRLWSCISKGDLEVDMQFLGLNCLNKSMDFAISDGYCRFDLRASMFHQEVMPQAHLKYLAQVVSPVDHKIEVLGGARDSLPRGRPIYQIILTYNFSVSRTSLEVSPKLSLLNDVLYESSYESQLWMVFDSNKQLIASGDAFYRKYSCKLDKGDYTLKVHVRHDKTELLEKLTDIPLTLIFKLSQEIKLDIFSSFNNALTGGRKSNTVLMSPDSIQHFYIMPPSLSDKALKNLNVTAGCSLLGQVTFSKDEQVRKADSYSLRVFISDASTSSKKRNFSSHSSSSADDKKELKSFGDYEDALRDFQTSWISKLESSASEAVYKEVNSKYSDHLNSAANRLQAMDTECTCDTRSTVIAFSKDLISKIDRNELLKFYGAKSDQRPDASKIRAHMEKQKSILLDALTRLGVSLISEMVENGTPVGDDVLPVDEIGREMLQFTEFSDTKVIGFFYQYYRVRNLFGLAARLACKQFEDKSTKENEEKVLSCFRILQWNHVVTHMESTQPTRFPPAFAPF